LKSVSPKPFAQLFPLWPFAPVYALGMALLEPWLERNPPLRLLLELRHAKKYLLVCPLGELVYFFKPLGRVPVRAAAITGLVLALAAMAVSGLRFKNRRLNRLGIYFCFLSMLELALEFYLRREFYLGPAQLRYLAMPGLGLGIFLLARDRGFLAGLVIAGFAWDLSSAIFWAGLNADLFARLPVPYWGTLDAAGSGAPALVPIMVDSLGICLGVYIAVSERDPLRVFWPPPAGR